MKYEKANITWTELIKLVADNGVCRYKYGDNNFEISLNGEDFNGDILIVYEDGTLAFKEKLDSKSYHFIPLNEVYTFEKIVNIIDKILSDEYDYRIESKLKVFNIV